MFAICYCTVIKTVAGPPCSGEVEINLIFFGYSASPARIVIKILARYLGNIGSSDGVELIHCQQTIPYTLLYFISLVCLVVV